MNETLHRKWFEEFVLELRLRDVPGDAIGDATASAREFLADSGQTPQEAFGAARDYAASLELPRLAATGLGRGTVARAAAGLLAFLLLTSTFGPLLDGETLRFALPQLLLLLVPVAAVSTLPGYFDALARNRWILAGVLVLVVVAGVLSSVFAPGPGDAGWISLPAAAVALAAASVLLATSSWGTILVLRTADDPLVDPFQGPLPSRGANVLTVVGHWVLPTAAMFFWMVALAMR